MAEPLKNENILTSKEEIMSYLGVGKAIVEKFLTFGMPVAIIDGRWYGHKENIIDWYKAFTRKQRQKGEL